MSQSPLNNSVKSLVDRAKSSGLLGNSQSLEGVAVMNNSQPQPQQSSLPLGLFSNQHVNSATNTSVNETKQTSPIVMKSLSNSLSQNPSNGGLFSQTNVPSFQNPPASSQQQMGIPGLFPVGGQGLSQVPLSQQPTPKVNPLTNFGQPISNPNPLMQPSNSQVSSFGTGTLFASMPKSNQPSIQQSLPVFNGNPSSNPLTSTKNYQSFPISQSSSVMKETPSQGQVSQNVASKLNQLKTLASQQKENQSASAKLSELVSPDKNQAVTSTTNQSQSSKIEELRRIASNSASTTMRSAFQKEDVKQDSKTTSNSILSEMKTQLEPSSNVKSASLGSASLKGSLSVADKIKLLKEQSNSVQSNSSSLAKNRASSPPRSVSQSMENSNRRPSHTEEQFKIDDVVSSELHGEEKPKVTGKEDVLAPHMEVFKRYGITIDKIFNDKDSDVIYLDAYTRVGANFVVEISNRKGVTLYLNDGHILEKHTGEEFDLSKKILEEECAALGTCGLFSQSGDKLVVASKKHGSQSVHKTSYIVTTVDSEKSLIENGKVVSLPVVQFEQLEQEESFVQELMLLVDTRYHEYCKKAADEALLVLQRSLADLDSARALCAAYINDNATANGNFEFRHGVALKNFAFYGSKGDEESIAKVAAGRKELFDDLQRTVVIGRELAKSIVHASKVKAVADEKLTKLREIGIKYV